MFTTWEARLREQWNEPSRSDYYTMQLTAIVRSLAGNQASVESQRIPWVFSYQTDNLNQKIDNSAFKRTANWLGISDEEWFSGN